MNCKNFPVDCHLHTKASHDSAEEPANIVRTAFRLGLKGITVTDHVDIGTEGDAFLSPAYESYRLYCGEFKEALENEEGAEGFEMLMGTEIGESVRNRKAAEKLIGDIPFDAVLGSVHKVYIDGKDFCFSNYRFSDLPEDLVRRVVKQYYIDVLETAKYSDIDVLAHINLINRYERKANKHDVYDEELGPVIREILKTLIRRNIALEVNTGVVCWGIILPETDILKVYREMGGSLVTFGSDAHAATGLGQGFEISRSMLAEAGFEKAYYFKQRKPVSYNIC